MNSLFVNEFIIELIPVLRVILISEISSEVSAFLHISYKTSSATLTL